jgi:hypothetical protein
MTTGRYGQSATLLQNGQVLVVGGNTVSFPELYDPSSGQFTAVAEPCRCVSFPAGLLGTGRVLVAGGTVGYHPVSTSGAELYDPSTQSWASTGSKNAARDTETMTVLSNGQALIAGGEQISNRRATELASAELYTP